MAKSWRARPLVGRYVSGAAAATAAADHRTDDDHYYDRATAATEDFVDDYDDDHVAGDTAGPFSGVADDGCSAASTVTAVLPCPGV